MEIRDMVFITKDWVVEFIGLKRPENATNSIHSTNSMNPTNPINSSIFS